MTEINPEKLIEIEQQLAEERARKLDALGQNIKKLIDEAVNARRSSGIERRWQEDEEYYEGIDDLNRGEDQYIKPRTAAGGLQTKRTISDDHKCTAFFNITRQFVDSGAARAGDILLPSNDWNFAIKPTPIPDELESQKEDQTPVIVDQNGQPISAGELIQAAIAKASKKVESAETRIRDWLVECNYKKEYRKMLDNCALVGTGILKGPAPRKQKSTKFSGGTLEIVEEILPGTKCVDHWDFYPDPNCGDNIQDGDFVVERDFMSARQLRDFLGMPGSGYIDESIKKVLKEGPNKRNDNSLAHRETQDDDRFEVWYYYGEVKQKDLALMDDAIEDIEAIAGEELDEIATVPAVIAIVNDTVIKGIISPLDNGQFPFDLMVWQRVAGSPWGIGIARQGRTAQKMVLSATRALMDNMGLSAIPMLAVMRSALQPMDGSWNLYPGKQWTLKESSGVRNINEAIQTLVIPSLQAELMNIIQLGMKMMEDATGVSFLLQGQQGSAPDTVGGMQLLHQNASALLRRIARNGDDVTIAHIKRYHDWLLIYGEDDEKGDMQIEAIGSTALVERELQAMQLPQILQLSLDPRYEKSPKRVFDEILRAWRFDPTKFDLDEEERAQLQEQMQAAQQQPMPQVEAAKIRAEVDLQKEQMRQQISLEKMRVDTDRDAVFSQGVTERNRMAYEKQVADTQLRIQEMELKRELAMLEYSNRHQVTLDQIKADLARDAMKINLQRELATINTNEAEQVITPPSEPPGRAPQGQAFQR